MSAYPFATTGGVTTASAPNTPVTPDSPNPFAGLAAPRPATPIPADAPNPFAGLADSHRASKAAPSRQTFPPTPEQQDILDEFATGKDMVIIAGAGTGKTSTITMLADALYDQDRTARGVYIAFNKAIATEVKSKFFYGNVDASTIHSLAFRGARNTPHLAPLLGKLGGRNGAVPLRVQERPKVFGVSGGITILRNPDEPMHPQDNPALVKIHGTTAVRAALDAITKWCQSAEGEVGPEHVILKKNQIATEARPEYRSRIAELARRIWDQDIMSPDGRLNFAHDYYLKAWALTKPDLCKQLGIQGRRVVLFFDEAQDSRPCITELVMNQRGKMQLVLCGDSSQAIYRFTGCQDAMKGFKETDGVTSLTLSKTFRFGPDIACVANQVLARIEGADIRIIPDYSVASIVRNDPDLPDAIICRSNAVVIENMLELLDAGKKVYCAANTQVIADVAHDYMRLVSGERPKSGAMKQFSSTEAITAYLRERSSLENEALSTGDEEIVDEIELDDALVATLRAIKRFGAVNILKGIRSLERTEATADIVVSTIHKSKGQQWDSVHVSWDVSDMTKIRHPAQLRDELMLLYVAVTRAKKRLELHPSVMGALGLDHPETREHELEVPTDTREREMFQLCHALDPMFPGEGVLDTIESGVTEGEVVRAYLSLSDLVGVSAKGDTRPHAPARVLAEVGVREYLDALDVAEAGFPVSLFATMLAVRGVTHYTDEVTDLLHDLEEQTS